jgi:hypothetical protein
MRHEISELQSGTANNSAGGNYWLFELGVAVALATPVQLSEEKHFRFAMCTLADLKAAKGWFDISGRYSYLYDTATEQSEPVA